MCFSLRKSTNEHELSFRIFAKKHTALLQLRQYSTPVISETTQFIIFCTYIQEHSLSTLKKSETDSTLFISVTYSIPS